MKKHVLKCRQPFFDLAWFKRKPVEIRFNDRDFKPGDEIMLCETRVSEDDPTIWIPSNRFIHNKIREVYTNLPGLEEGYAFLVLDQILFQTVRSDGNVHSCPSDIHPPQAGLPKGDLE